MSSGVGRVQPGASSAGPQEIRFFKKDSHIPQQYFEIFKRLEVIMPLTERIAEIDNLYFTYARENNIRAGSKMTDVEDPYLFELATYREYCQAKLA